MSSPTPQGTAVPKEKKEKGIRGAIRRMGTVLRKIDPSKRRSTLLAQAGPSTTAPAASTRYAFPSVFNERFISRSFGVFCSDLRFSSSENRLYQTDIDVANLPSQQRTAHQ